MEKKKSLTYVALLAPVPIIHLKSAKGLRVALATKNRKLFSKLEQLRNDSPVDVYIYADGKISYGARYIELIRDKHKVMESNYRPASTESDTDEGEVFWVVEDLHKLTSEMNIATFTGYGKKRRYANSFSPHGPLIVEHP